MKRKLAMPMAVGAKAVFTRAGSQECLGHLQLVSFKVDDGRLSWYMWTENGFIVEGNAMREVQNPLLGPGYWVKPVIPIRMDVRNGGSLVVPNMIFLVPASVSISIED